jgi:hypothetical protein
MTDPSQAGMKSGPLRAESRRSLRERSFFNRPRSAARSKASVAEAPPRPWLTGAALENSETGLAIRAGARGVVVVRTKTSPPPAARYHPRVADAAALTRELEEIGTQLAWVREYL